MRTARSALVLALAFTLACGSEPTALESDGPEAVESVDVVENDSLAVQAARVSDTVVAVLRDANGNPVSGEISSWEVNGEGGDICGFWEASTLESNASGEVKNRLNAPTFAHTAFSSPPDCRYRVVHSREGAPEPVIDSVSVTVQPGPAVKLSVDRVTEDGTRDEFGDDGDARARLDDVWQDTHGNPAYYEAAVTEGPATVKGGKGETTWPRRVVPTGPEGTGTVEAWSLPDSSETVTGTFEVWHYGPENNETWICVFFSAQEGDETCEGPPNL